MNNSRFPDHSKELDMQLTGWGALPTWGQEETRLSSTSGKKPKAGGTQTDMSPCPRDPDRHTPVPRVLSLLRDPKLL